VERVTQSDSNNLHSDQRDDLSRLEALIQEERLSDARDVLRSILSSQADTVGTGESIGDALAILVRQPSKHPLAAIALLRCLAIDGLIPEPNPTNNIVDIPSHFATVRFLTSWLFSKSTAALRTTRNLRFGRVAMIGYRQS
jgi:hypothetical protein